MDRPVFVDGRALALEGPVSVMAEVTVKGIYLSLSDCWFYPLTGSRVTLGTREVLTIFRIISDQALEQECSTCSAEGLRVSGARPRRYDHVVEEAEMKWSGAPETPTALVEHFRSVTALACLVTR